MHYFLYLTAMFALVAADGYYYEAPAARTPLLWSTLSAAAPQYQYHTQDGFGQYTYGYGEPLSTKQEVRTLDGITRGSYTYLDAAGKLQTVAYTADADGFRVAATNLPKQRLPLDSKTSFEIPQPVQDTREVAEARLQHLAAHQQAKLGLFQISKPITPIPAPTPVLKAHSTAVQKRVDRLDILPQPVEDTPEVAAAKVQFFKRYEEVKQRDERLRQQQEQLAGYALVKAQPVTLTVPLSLSNYKPALIPSGVFRYDIAAPSNNREYLPIAKFNL